MKARYPIMSLVFSVLISPAWAGGFEGGGGDLASPIFFVIGVIMICVVPMAASEGAYVFGDFSVWQLPLVAAMAILATIVLRPWRGGPRLLALPLIYVLPVLVTNFWAISHRVDHSHDFPTSRVIDQIDWRFPPTEDELTTKAGSLVSRAQISVSDLNLPIEVRNSISSHNRSEAIVLVFSETAWDMTVWRYVLFDTSTHVYFGAAGYNDWHKRPRPDRWPHLK